MNKRFLLFYVKFVLGPALLIVVLFFLSSWSMIDVVLQTKWLVWGFFWLIVFVLIISFGLVKLYNRNYFYEVNDKGLILKKGIFAIKLIIPYNRIGSVEITKDFLHKLFNLYALEVVINKDSSWKKLF
jgi:membrane protein YdbS with pleckstrin-like domain